MESLIERLICGKLHAVFNDSVQLNLPNVSLYGVSRAMAHVTARAINSQVLPNPS